MALAAVTACGAVAGCGGPGSTGGGSSSSRAQIYDSLDRMADDSALILAGTAGEQRTVTDLEGSSMEFDLTTFTVDDVVRADDGTAAGSTVTVRQVGCPTGYTCSPQDAPLVTGERYLLFLVRSGLPGEAAAQLYPVGVVAGIYRADGDAFTRLVPGSGDTLPLTVTADDLRGWGPP